MLRIRPIQLLQHDLSTTLQRQLTNTMSNLMSNLPLQTSTLILQTRTLNPQGLSTRQQRLTTQITPPLDQVLTNPQTQDGNLERQIIHLVNEIQYLFPRVDALRVPVTADDSAYDANDYRNVAAIDKQSAGEDDEQGDDQGKGFFHVNDLLSIKIHRSQREGLYCAGE